MSEGAGVGGDHRVAGQRHIALFNPRHPCDSHNDDRPARQHLSLHTGTGRVAVLSRGIREAVME